MNTFHTQIGNHNIYSVYYMQKKTKQINISLLMTAGVISDLPFFIDIGHVWVTVHSESDNMACKQSVFEKHVDFDIGY